MTRRVSGGATAAPALLEERVGEALHQLASRMRRMGCPEAAALLVALEKLRAQLQLAEQVAGELVARRDYVDLVKPVQEVASKVLAWDGDADAARTMGVQADALAIRVHAVLVR